MSAYGVRKVKRILEPALEQNCPSIAKRLFLSKLTMGTNPFTILGMKVLSGKPSNDFVDLDVDFKWVSNLTMAITIELKVGTVMTFNVTNLQFSGTTRIQCW
jgi:Ca2+-dependent lipid-binding protein